MLNCAQVYALLGTTSAACCPDCHDFEATYGYGLTEAWVQDQQAAVCCVVAAAVRGARG